MKCYNAISGTLSDIKCHLARVEQIVLSDILVSFDSSFLLSVFDYKKESLLLKRDLGTKVSFLQSTDKHISWITESGDINQITLPSRHKAVFGCDDLLEELDKTIGSNKQIKKICDSQSFESFVAPHSLPKYEPSQNTEKTRFSFIASQKEKNKNSFFTPSAGKLVRRTSGSKKMPPPSVPPPPISGNK